MTGAREFSVSLHHLAPDLRAAGVQYPDIQLEQVTPERLRELLEGLGAIAKGIEFPVAPEIRISAESEQYVVQVRGGHVRFSSWSVRAGGEDLSPAQILAAITGVEPETSPGGAGMAGWLGGRPRVSKVVLLALAILGSNGATVWMLNRPEPSLLPEYRLLAAEPGGRLLADVAGVYETGSASGDRALNIGQDGSVLWVTFGENRTVDEEENLTAQPAQSGGRPVLLTSELELIEIVGPLRVIYYGDTYHRKSP